MPTYKVKLEARIYCPESSRNPELVITPRDIRNAFLQGKRADRGYAVCAPDDPSKLTADMVITEVEFEEMTCSKCGSKVAVDRKDAR